MAAGVFCTFGSRDRCGVNDPFEQSWVSPRAMNLDSLADEAIVKHGSATADKSSLQQRTTKADAPTRPGSR
jgi:hypothetical protein